MKWLKAGDPDMNNWPILLNADLLETIHPSSGPGCYVTLSTRGKQFKVDMSAEKLMEWLEK